MHGYVHFCIFAWVVNNVVGPSQKRKRKIICTQTHANCVNFPHQSKYTYISIVQKYICAIIIV